jgi:TPR repeat protein
MIGLRVIAVAVALLGIATPARADDAADCLSKDLGYLREADLATVVAACRHLADKGVAAAQNRLGVMYDMGKGVTRDYEEAMLWFRKAANQGYAAAQFNLGFENEVGLGNYAESVQWYERAANQGFKEAQHRLGLMYHNGRGTAKDDVAADMWYRLAAASGDAEANRLREAIEKYMTASQIEEAKRRSSEWKPAKP